MPGSRTTRPIVDGGETSDFFPWIRSASQHETLQSSLGALLTQPARACSTLASRVFDRLAVISHGFPRALCRRRRLLPPNDLRQSWSRCRICESHGVKRCLFILQHGYAPSRPKARDRRQENLDLGLGSTEHGPVPSPLPPSSGVRTVAWPAQDVQYMQLHT